MSRISSNGTIDGVRFCCAKRTPRWLFSEVQVKEPPKLAVHGEVHDRKMHKADAVVRPVRTAEPSVARGEGARCTEVEQAFRAPYEPRLGKRRLEEDAGAARRAQHRRQAPLLNRRLGDRDDGVAARARPHRYDALHQPIKRREAVIGVLLARAWETACGVPRTHP